MSFSSFPKMPCWLLTWAYRQRGGHKGMSLSENMLLINRLTTANKKCAKIALYFAYLRRLHANLSPVSGDFAARPPPRLCRWTPPGTSVLQTSCLFPISKFQATPLVFFLGRYRRTVKATFHAVASLGFGVSRDTKWQNGVGLS